jgi:hypothetical protein
LSGKCEAINSNPIVLERRKGEREGGKEEEERKEGRKERKEKKNLPLTIPLIFSSFLAILLTIWSFLSPLDPAISLQPFAKQPICLCATPSPWQFILLPLNPKVTAFGDKAFTDMIKGIRDHMGRTPI